MSSSDIHYQQQKWWHGVSLWYNDQDYLAAMQVWWSMIGDEQWEDYDAPILTGGIDVGDAQDTDILRTSGDLDQQKQWMAPLLLFLAGCYLDAAEYAKARLLLTRCLRSMTNTVADTGPVDSSETVAATSLIINRALAEYMACAQEDPGIREPWIVSRETLEWAASTTRCVKNAMIQWKDPYQRPGFMSVHVTSSQPVYTEAEQPDWCRDLAAHWTEIRDEYLLLSGQAGAAKDPSVSASSTTTTTIPARKAPAHWPRVGAGSHREGAGAHDSTVVSPGGDWRELVLFGSGAQPEKAPRTAALVQRYAASAVDLAEKGGGEVIFSVLAPKTRIQPHTAGTNIRLTAHLGLVIPNTTTTNKDDACRIRIRDTWCQWEPGEMLVFDDSYEHEVRNDSDECRAVLLMRFWHPNLAVQKRREVLDQALQSKENDRLRRYNPPIPVRMAMPMSVSSGSNANSNNRNNGSTGTSSGIVDLVQGRGMERTQCAQCWRTGFETIRVVERGGGDDYVFVCSCGQVIAS
jgi:hypothetical protein